MIHIGASPPERSRPDRPELRPAVELLPRVLEALPVGVAVFEVATEDFKFRYGNRAFVRLLALERMPADGQPVGDVFNRAEHDAVLELFRLVSVSREPQSYFAAEGGQGPTADRIWNIDVYPILSGGRVSHVLVMAEQSQEKLDVRQRQQLEANRLRKKADQLASLEKAKSEFLRLASHELRGPAATLSGYLSMIEDGTLGPIPQRLRPVLPMLKAKTAQINLLANEMVEAARLEDGRLQLKRKRLDLRELLRRSLKAAEPNATPKHRLNFEDRVGHELWVLADQMRLEIVMDNLVDNAIKYSPAGGDVTAQVSAVGGQAGVSVRDQGVGTAAAAEQPGLGLEPRTFVQSSGAQELIPHAATLSGLRDAAAGCRACDLYKTGTQTVFGEGAQHAAVMFVGEQPGDREDIEGKPFVGPAGRLLDEALEEAGIDRTRVYITNAVKHFKWKPQGKRRLHQKPNAAEISACRPWLDSEIALVKPRILVLLGATAAQAMLGRDFRVSLQRGQFIERPGLPLMMATVHPSSILRAPDDESREIEMQAFVQDLKRLAQRVKGS